jgi:hypothetical protein
LRRLVAPAGDVMVEPEAAASVGTVTLALVKEDA